MTSNLITATFLAYRDMLELLDALPAHEADGLTAAEIASRTGRVASNLRRDTAKFEREGYLAQGGDASRFVLGETGRAALAAWRKIDATPVTGDTPVWPLDKFRRNPDQPRKHFPDDMIVDRAESIVQAGGLLHPLIVEPADANGVRMIQDGECRWRAAQLLVQEGRLPEALQGGLPYIEHAGGEAEMLTVALIANAQRADLTPWEDAQGLLRLKKLLDLPSARAVAFRLGRAKEGSERGVADVQQKIRTAEEASAKDIADHEAGKITWEELRERTRKPRALSPDARLAMIELRWKLTNDPVKTDDGQIWVIDDGYGYQDLGYRELREAGFIETYVGLAEGVHASMCRLTSQGQAWLAKTCRGMGGLGHDIEHGTLNQAQLEHERRTSGAAGQRIVRAATDQGYTTSWLNNMMAAAAVERQRNGEPDPEPVEDVVATPAKTDVDRPSSEIATLWDQLSPTPAEALALVELQARIRRRQHVSYGRARLFQPAPSAFEAKFKRILSPLTDGTKNPWRDYLGLTAEGEHLLAHARLWTEFDTIDAAVERARRVEGAWTWRGLALGEYATEWLSFRGMVDPPTTTATSPAAQTAVSQGMAEVRAELVDTDATAAPAAETFDDIEKLERDALNSRINSCMGLRSIRREAAGKPALDDRPLAEIADDAVSEFMRGQPFVGAMHLATLALRARRDGLVPTAADQAWGEALQRWQIRHEMVDQVLMTLKVGDLVNNGGASDYRLISRKDHHDSRVFDFVVQPVLHGRDYGGQRAMNLSQIQRLGGANNRAGDHLQDGQPKESSDAAA